MFQDWPRDSEGKAIIYPLVAYETLVPHGLLCGLRLHYLQDSAELLAGRSSSVPLVMTVDMARALAAALIKTADEAERGPAPEGRH